MEGRRINSVWLWLSDEENWERFGRDDVDQIEHAIDIGNKGVVIERNHTTYFIDILRSTQTNACTGRRRPVYRVQRGYAWLSRDAETTGVWEPFSAAEAKELEQAFFEDSKESIILQRGNETHYVDFMKWTIADLSTGCTRHLKVMDEYQQREAEQATSVPDPAQAHLSTRSRSTSRSRSPSPSRRNKMKADIKDSQVDREERKKLENEIDSECECTVTTVPDDYDNSLSSHEVPLFGKPIRRSVSRKTRASWRWENDSMSWSYFDEQVAAAIERSWECGAPEMMFEHASEAYFVDLVNLTQTNIITGNTRAIQRLEE